MQGRYVVFDTEMPGQLGFRISAIAITVVEDGIITDSMYYLVNPETQFDPYVIELVGITPEMVADKPAFPEIWEKIKDVMSSGTLVAHGASCDMRALCGCLNSYGIEWKKEVKYICTCDMAISYFKNEPKYGLSQMCEKIGFELDHHNAKSDSEGCASLLIYLADHGVDTEKFTYTFDALQCHKERPPKTVKPKKRGRIDERARNVIRSCAKESIRRELCKKNPQIDKEKIAGADIRHIYKYAAAVKKHGWDEEFFSTLPHQLFEEDELHAILISKCTSYSKCIEHINNFIDYIESDAVVSLIKPKIFSINLSELSVQADIWLNDKREYSVSLAISLCEKYLMTSDYIEIILELLSEINPQSYYISDKTAHFFSLALLKFSKETLPYFKNNVLDKRTHNMALQMAKFSKGTTDEQKDFFTKMRR